MINKKVNSVEHGDIFSDLLNQIDQKTLIEIIKYDPSFFSQFYYHYLKKPSPYIIKKIKTLTETQLRITELEYDFFDQSDEETKISLIPIISGQSKLLSLLRKTNPEKLSSKLLEYCFKYLTQYSQYEIICDIIYANRLKLSLELQKALINNKELSYIAISNLISSEIITEMECFHILIQKNKNYLDIVKKSKYWKDDANLILKVMNE